MFEVPSVRRRVFLRLLRWRIIVRHHPLRASLTCSLLACVLTFSLFHQFIVREISKWLTRLSHPIFLAVQAHPALGRFVHILINAVPDSAFALLAVAGLAYLVPGYTKKIEDKRGVRVFLMIFFTMFGAMAIIINAVNREAQDYKDAQSEERMGVVLKSVTHIQEALEPKAINMTEAERHVQLLNSLRDEYIIRQSSIDPEILSGIKIPPTEWMNKRLSVMGEKWTVKEEAKPGPSQVVQLPPETKRTRLKFSFFQPEMSVSNLKTVLIDPMTDDKISVRVAAIVDGDAAENLQIWIRVCKYCQWIPPEPTGLLVSGPDFPFDRVT